MLRLLKPLEYYKKKYGTYCYGLNKLYLLMEKQHNRGQEGAGLGCVKLHSVPGHEYVYRERALGPNAIQEIFGEVGGKFARSAPRARAAYPMCTLSCGATIGGRATCCFAATSI